MFAYSVVILSSLQPNVLRQFHAAHPGTSRMKSIARSFAYWPGIDGDIDDLVRRCFRCQQAAKMPPPHPIVPRHPPERPWSRVHIDFAGPLNGVSYLILVDAYSKWPEMAPLNPATASATIAFLRRTFSQHGLPEVLVSDNGSQFTSSSFEDFCRQHNIQHLRSPPYHPQSNGQAERFVDTFKRALSKARGEGTTDEIVQALLFSYRTTPNPASPGSVSPTEALIGRKLRTTFHALVPTGAQPAQISPVSRSKLPIGTPVFVRDYRAGFPDWIEAAVVAHRGSMLFDVDVGDDIWDRHHNQIRWRHCNNTTGLVSVQSLLLDTFRIPADRSVPETTAASPSDVPSSVSVIAPVSPDNKPRLRRRTNRMRRSTWPMQVNPRQKRHSPTWRGSVGSVETPKNKSQPITGGHLFSRVGRMNEGQPQQKKTPSSQSQRSLPKRHSSSGIDTYLQAVQGDIQGAVTNTWQQNVRRTRYNELEVGATPVVLTTSTRYYPGPLPSQKVPKLYREHVHRFHTEPLPTVNPFELQSAYPPTRVTLTTDANRTENADSRFTYYVQLFITKLGNLLLGILAGLAIANTIICSVFLWPGQTSEESSLQAAYGYSQAAEGISIAFFILLVVIGIGILDRCDVARPTRDCFSGCFALQNSFIILPVFLLTFCVNNAMYWFNNVFTVLEPAKFDNLTRQLNAGGVSVSTWITIWKILDAARTAGILFTWLFVALSSRNSDRLLSYLLKQPESR
ncbi:hypothetical protein SprV_0301325400 [Sparganum proliferum]